MTTSLEKFSQTLSGFNANENELTSFTEQVKNQGISLFEGAEAETRAKLGALAGTVSGIGTGIVAGKLLKQGIGKFVNKYYGKPDGEPEDEAEDEGEDEDVKDLDDEPDEDLTAPDDAVAEPDMDLPFPEVEPGYVAPAVAEGPALEEGADRVLNPLDEEFGTDELVGQGETTNMSLSSTLVSTEAEADNLATQAGNALTSGAQAASGAISGAADSAAAITGGAIDSASAAASGIASGASAAASGIASGVASGVAAGGEAVTDIALGALELASDAAGPLGIIVGLGIGLYELFKPSDKPPPPPPILTALSLRQTVQPSFDSLTDINPSSASF